MILSTDIGIILVLVSFFPTISVPVVVFIGCDCNTLEAIEAIFFSFFFFVCGCVMYFIKSTSFSFFFLIKDKNQHVLFDVCKRINYWIIYNVVQAIWLCIYNIYIIYMYVCMYTVYIYMFCKYIKVFSMQIQWRYLYNFSLFAK